jgi:hypothetical protein
MLSIVPPHIVQERRRSRKDGDVLVAGFCLPKGLAPVLPIYLHAILTGAPFDKLRCQTHGMHAAI